MTIPTDASDALLASYRRDHDLPAELDSHGRILVPTGRVDAIQMPRAVGDRVHAELQRLKLHTPILENLGTARLTFITAAARPDDLRPVVVAGHHAEHGLVSLRRNAGLTSTTVIRSVPGAWIALPAAPDDERWRWLAAPVGALRAPFDLLIELALAAGNRLQRTADDAANTTWRNPDLDTLEAVAEGLHADLDAEIRGRHALR
ncbi:hypothetical protein [Nocardia cyriacigeorgica]|uniref:hypothetical protein n=1 Tax=Nocardia cyriacigeorgica TaxID=135487 RepID=UPI001895953A|nr:hypothetical protein [Nocardia cyriacigeorgica]MBF6290128.1 hypothetical protein [Nocardia cyriacigeorgica]